MARRYNAGIGPHELHHAGDVRDIVDETNAMFRNKHARGCGLTEADARRDLDKKVDALLKAAKEHAYKRDGEESDEFHGTSRGRNGRLDCSICPPPRPLRRRRR